MAQNGLPGVVGRVARLTVALAVCLTVMACAKHDNSALSEIGRSLATPVDYAKHVEETRQAFAGMSRSFSTSAGAPQPGPNDTHAVVKVYYATNRKAEVSESKRVFYGNEEAPVSYGAAYVSIPREHRMGRLESAPVWRFWNTDDPDQYVVLLSLGLMKRDVYLAEVRNEVRRARRHDALIFIHGYYVTFEDAARRTAQMKYDLGFDGPAAFFSWPSKGSVSGYERDLVAMRQSVDEIKTFLSEFAQSSGSGTIYLVAHSMGNLGTLTALSEMSPRERSKVIPKFREIILAAPDIDRTVFVNEILPKVGPAGSRLTLYASAEDRALQLAARVHGQRRVGDIGAGVVFARSLDTVDATGVDTSLVGHTYYAENRSIISDMYYLIQQGVPPGQRFGLEPVVEPEGTYWRFKR